MKAIVVAAALAGTGVAGAAEPAAFRECAGRVLGTSGPMLLDAGVASTPRIGRDCASRGYVEGVTVYRISCRDALSLVHRLPVRLEPTWVAHGFEIAFYVLAALMLVAAVIAATFVESKPGAPEQEVVEGGEPELALEAA